MKVRLLLCLAAVAAAIASPALAQRGEPAVRRVERLIPRLSPPARPAQLERLRRGADDARPAAALVERDALGRLHRRDEVVLASRDDAAAAAAAVALGLTEITRTALPASGLTLVRYRAPEGVGAADAAALLRAARPDDAVDLNVVYTLQDGDGAADASPSVGADDSQPFEPAGFIVGLVDGGLAPSEAPADVPLLVRRFVEGPVAGGPHASRVAEILTRSASASVSLVAADVVASDLEGASADALAAALDWMASQGAIVINVSLAGPPNAPVAAVAEELAARGHVIVAAAGNDGPRAPPSYPAALPGVLAVTAVDARGRAWRRAARGEHVDFAALGVRVRTGDGARVSGTSYAAPVVAARLAARLDELDADARAAALEALAGAAKDLGDPGPDPVYGAGLIEPAAPAQLAERDVERK